MPETYYIIPKEKHDSLVTQAYLKRGYDTAEAAAGARFCASAAYYGIRTHNAIKALHLDELFGSKVGRWTPGAKIEKLPSRFAAAEIWNGHHKLGQAVAPAPKAAVATPASRPVGSPARALTRSVAKAFGGKQAAAAVQEDWTEF